VDWLLRALYWSALAVTAIYLLRNQLGWQGPNHALGLQMAFFFIPVLARYTGGERVRLWEWAVVALQLAIPISLGTRTAWTALFVALVFLMLTARRRFGVWVTVAAALAGLVLVAIVAPAATEPIQQQAESFAARPGPSSDSNAAANASWREEFWKHDLRGAVHHPVTGVGFGPASDFCFSGNGECWDTRLTRDADQISGPHNGFVDVLYRMGLPGLLLLLGLLWTAVRSGLRALPDPVARTALALLLFATVTAFFSVALEGPYMGIPFWALVGMLWVCGREEAQRH
jgi:O-antigen ligase